MPDGQPTGPGQPGAGGAPIAPGLFGAGGASILAPGQFAMGGPVGGPASRFQIFGAPIAVLGGVFAGGLPIGGPVTQIFRGGAGPQPPVLFLATITPAGPIGGFLVGSAGAPIGVEAFGGGGLPIGVRPAVAREVEAIQPRTALVGAAPPFGALVPPALAFGNGRAVGPVPPIGAGGR